VYRTPAAGILYRWRVIWENAALSSGTEDHESTLAGVAGSRIGVGGDGTSGRQRIIETYGDYGYGG